MIEERVAELSSFTLEQAEAIRAEVSRRNRVDVSTAR